jgi:hypothetical protein
LDQLGDARLSGRERLGLQQHLGSAAPVARLHQHLGQEAVGDEVAGVLGHQALQHGARLVQLPRLEERAAQSRLCGGQPRVLVQHEPAQLLRFQRAAGVAQCVRERDEQRGPRADRRHAPLAPLAHVRAEVALRQRVGAADCAPRSHVVSPAPALRD